MLVLDKKIQRDMFSHAEREYPHECCGVLLGKRVGEKHIAYRAVCSENNSRTDKKVHFTIDPLEIFEIEAAAAGEQLEIVGFYHSHPECAAALSKTDEAYMLEEYSYPIISIKGRVDGMYFNIASFEKIIGANICSEEQIIIESEK